MAIHDIGLENRILKKLDALERAIDSVGPTPLRHSLNEKVVGMRTELINFNQTKYEEGIN